MFQNFVRGVSLQDITEAHQPTLGFLLESFNQNWAPLAKMRDSLGPVQPRVPEAARTTTTTFWVEQFLCAFRTQPRGLKRVAVCTGVWVRGPCTAELEVRK